jgi:hypothetical protein
MKEFTTRTLKLDKATCTLSLELTDNHLYLEAGQTTTCTSSLELTDDLLVGTVRLDRQPLAP